jgi:hypothetical protein
MFWCQASGYRDMTLGRQVYGEGREEGVFNLDPIFYCCNEEFVENCSLKIVINFIKL